MSITKQICNRAFLGGNISRLMTQDPSQILQWLRRRQINGQQVVYLLAGSITVAIVWRWYNKKEIIQRKSKTISTRYTHFLSIRITNPLIIGLGTEIQDEIVNQYKQNTVSIQSSLIKQCKFHVSLNILSLPTEGKLHKFCNALDLFEQWLKLIPFNHEGADNITIQDDGVFLNVVHTNNYFNRFKDIYTKCTFIQLAPGIPLYVEGVNHFTQRVVFLDFENKCKSGSEDNAFLNSMYRESSRNGFVLQWIRMIHELIGKLCKAYDIKCDKKKLTPHCTLMKLSKMKRKEMKKLVHYNKTNSIHKIRTNKENHRRTPGRNAYKVYDADVLSCALGEKRLLGYYQVVSEIDLCQMQGTSSDGYYKTVCSFSVIPRTSTV